VNSNKTIRRSLGVVAAGAAAATMVLGAGVASADDAPAPCKANDLSVTLSPINVSGQDRTATLDFQTKGDVTCTLTNDLGGFLFADRNAPPAPLPTAANQTSDKKQSVVVTPQAAGHIDLSWSVSDQPIHPGVLGFTLPAEGGPSFAVWPDNGLVNAQGAFNVGDLHL
jgi:hypothetical protein